MLNMKEKIKYFNGKVVCPRCDGNGLVYKATLIPINAIVFICDECEATWLNTFISKGNFQDFTSYIASLGYTYDQIDLNNINYDWHQMEK